MLSSWGWKWEGHHWRQFNICIRALIASKCVQYVCWFRVSLDFDSRSYQSGSNTIWMFVFSLDMAQKNWTPPQGKEMIPKKTTHIYPKPFHFLRPIANWFHPKNHQQVSKFHNISVDTLQQISNSISCWRFMFYHRQPNMNPLNLPSQAWPCWATRHKCCTFACQNKLSSELRNPKNSPGGNSPYKSPSFHQFSMYFNSFPPFSQPFLPALGLPRCAPPARRHLRWQRVLMARQASGTEEAPGGPGAQKAAALGPFQEDGMRPQLEPSHGHMVTWRTWLTWLFSGRP